MRQLARVSAQARRYVTTVASGNDALNAFITRPATPISSDTADVNGALKGHSVAIKDNICTSFLPTTCASAGLRTFTPPYNATVVDGILAAGGSIAGKTNLDEFGMGSNSISSFFGPVRTASGHSAGGSSGGSAVAVANGMCDSALGTDTGGSVRLPAAYNGIVGFKPSYGGVSRWGVVAYANSLDTVGFMAKDVEVARKLFEVCNEHDGNDPTSLSASTRDRIEKHLERAKRKGSLRIGVPTEYNIAELDPKWRQLWQETLYRLQKQGHSIYSISLPHTHQALSAYYVLAPAEASSNLAKYDGVRYGTPAQPKAKDLASTSRPEDDPSHAAEQTQDRGPGNNLFTATRDAFFGPEVKRRILLGAYTLSAEAMNNYFIRAQQIRRLVCQDFDRAFALSNPLREEAPLDSASLSDQSDGVDIVLTPTTPGPAPIIDDLDEQLKKDPLRQYTSDVFTVPASLAGLPAVSVPGPERFGIQILGQFGDDAAVLDAAQAISRLQ